AGGPAARLSGRGRVPRGALSQVRALRPGLIAVTALAVAGGSAAAWWAWRAERPRAGEALAIEWRPAASLAAGVTAREGRARKNPGWRVVEIGIDLTRAELRVAR